MSRPELLILIPCHSLEDFPTDLGEADAAGLLNAFSAAYHPVLLATTRELPAWRRADDPPTVFDGKIIVVPSCSQSWLPHGWSETASSGGAVVIENISDRQELVTALLEGLQKVAPAKPENGLTSPEGKDLGGISPVGDITPTEAAEPDHDSGLVADFLAFGTAFLQVELLTRRMHYYSNLDSGPARLELVGAAEAVISGDAEQARRRLSRAFEALLDARERFFPVDAYLIDLCLLIPRLADRLEKTLSPFEPTTLLATAADWEKIAANHPALIERLKTEWGNRRVDLVGGSYQEGPTSVLPIESVLWEIDRGQDTFRKLFGRTPQVWARRRYGFSSLMPQLLDRARLPFAIHTALDDGYYPDDEHSKFRWEGCDGVGVDAFSRIPLAADSAATFLRFPQRLAESMEEDQAAAVMFARWPDVASPWFEDMRRIHRYAPVFGKFVTLEAFFEDTDPPGRTHQHSATGYFPPYLTQAVARQEPNPISRFGDAVRRRHRFDVLAWLKTIGTLLRGSSDTSETVRIENEVELALANPDEEAVAALDESLSVATNEAANELGSVLSRGVSDGNGLIVFNPVSIPRRTTIELPEGFEPPAVAGFVKHVQRDNTRRSVTLDLPSAGFVWLPAKSNVAETRTDTPPTAEEGVLRNEFFEVHLSELTGGIAYIKGYGRKPKRLSQQLAFRFPRKRRLDEGTWGDENSYYSEMRCRSLELTCTGPSLGEAITTGDLVDQTNGDVLASFRQVVRLWRGRPEIAVEIELQPNRLPEGDPWSNYFACRFAWNDETAVVTRSVQQTAQPTPTARFDAPHYIEIAEDEMRTTIVPVGLPFHRRVGDRMLDTLLIVSGESRRSFRFIIACDEPYPMRTAIAAYCPPVLVPSRACPASGASGWFLHIDGKNVLVTRIEALPVTSEQPPGVRVRLMETEGRGRRARLMIFKQPSSARVVNLVGEPIGTADIEDGAVVLDLHKYEIATLELRF